jgi:putative cardiolipin synthase
MTLAAAALKVAIVALIVAATLRFILGRRLAAAMARPRDEGGALFDDSPPNAGPMASAARRLAAERPGLTGIAMLADGPAAFAARVALIDAARASVDAQYYIWHADLTGSILLEALKRAADRGVRVRLLIDDNGLSGLDGELAQLAAHPNAAVRLFNPFMLRWPKWLNLPFDFRRLNRRMHNKALIADGAAVIMGGRNVGDAYFGAGDTTIFVDLDVLAVGEAAPEVQADFERYWRCDAAVDAARIIGPHAGGDPIGARAAAVAADPAADRFRAALAASDEVARLADGRLDVEWVQARFVSDDPRKAQGLIRDEELLFSRLTSLVGQPEHRLDLVSPYLVPGRAGTRALALLARRGIAVRVLTNALEATDVVPVHAGYAKRRRTLLKAGVVLFELKRGASPASDGGRDARALGPFGSSGGSLHAKTFAVDGRTIYVGSFNFDLRSLRLNTESGLVIDSEKLARRLHENFDGRLDRIAYRPVLVGRRLVWRDAGTILQREPGASLGRRALLAAVNRLPVEWLL